MAISATAIRTILLAGTYTDTTLTENRFYIAEQPKARRRFPSVEIVEAKPTGNVETKEKSEFTTIYQINYYARTRGGQTTAADDEEVSITITQDEILTLIEAASLEDHKLVLEQKDWDVKRFPDQIPSYVLSTLRITVRKITAPPSGTPDGVLVYDISSSIGDNKPGSNYTYTQVFNTDIDDGHNKFDEYHVNNANPVRYAGGFRGSFITHVRVSSADLGSTDDKLNNLTKLKTNGEFPVAAFIYTDKDDTTPTPTQIQEAIKLTIDDVQRQYRVGDNTIFRILASPIERSTVT